MYILDHFALFAFFQSLFLMVIYLISSRKRQYINPYLFILIGILTIGLLGKIGSNSLQWGRQLKGLSEFAVLLFGPTVYLFVQSTLSVRRLSSADLLHYIPAVIYSLIVTFYYILPPHEVILARIDSGELYRVVHILVATGLAVNITYFVLSVMQFNMLRKNLQEEASYLLNVQFVRNFLLAIGVCLFVWLVVYLLSFGQWDQLEIVAREFIWLAIVFIILFIAYYQMISPAVFEFKSLVKETKYAQSRFSHAELDALKLRLEALMEQKKPYLNAKLMKSELAELMEINAPELSRLLNERVGMSFFEYVNYHRIHEFIRLAKTPLVQQRTLLALAQEAGFQSKSTFNKSFKQIMGCPPSEYLRNLN